MCICTALSLTHTYTQSYPLRVLLDPLALLELLVRMDLVVSVEMLVPLVHLESRVWSAHLVHKERRGLLESLAHL